MMFMVIYERVSGAVVERTPARKLLVIRAKRTALPVLRYWWTFILTNRVDTTGFSNSCYHALLDVLTPPPYSRGVGVLVVRSYRTAHSPEPLARRLAGSEKRPRSGQVA